MSATPVTESLRPSVALALALAVTLVAHLDALGVGFVWDDHALIEDREDVHTVQPLHTYFTRMFWSDPLSIETRDFYRPLVSLSFSTDWVLGDGSPLVFHVTNLLAHLVAAALLFAWARRLGAPPVSAALATALWATFPRLTESVTWISGRTDVFATVGVLGALVLWPFGGGSLARRLGAAACLLAGLFSKEVAAAGLVGLVAGEWWVTRSRAAVRALWPVALAGLAYAAARLAVPSTSGQLITLGAWRPVFSLQALGTYALMVVDALRPSLQIGMLGLLEPLALAAGAAVVVAAAVLGPRWLRRGPRPEAVASVGALAVGLGLVLHVVPLPMMVVACDRFLYLPVSMLLVLLAPTLVTRNRMVMAGVLLLTFVGATRLQIGRWSNEVDLWVRIYREADPRNPLPAGVLAELVLDLHLADEAAQLYRQSFAAERRFDADRVGTRVDTGVPQGRLNLAVALEELGAWEEAAALFDQLLAFKPEWRRMRYGRVMLALRRLRPEEAEAELATIARDLGADEVHAKLSAATGELRRDLAALPAEDTHEPLEIRLRRVRMFERLGSRSETNRLWRLVLADPGSPREVAVEGLASLVLHAAPPAARAALSSRSSTLPQAEVDALSSQLERREAALAALGDGR